MMTPTKPRRKRVMPKRLAEKRALAITDDPRFFAVVQRLLMYGVEASGARAHDEKRHVLIFPTSAEAEKFLSILAERGVTPAFKKPDRGATVTWRSRVFPWERESDGSVRLHVTVEYPAVHSHRIWDAVLRPRRR